MATDIKGLVSKTALGSTNISPGGPQPRLLNESRVNNSADDSGATLAKLTSRNVTNPKSLSTTEYLKETNAFIFELHTHESNLQNATDIVARQIEGARDLKDALESGNSEKIQTAQKELALLQNEQQKLQTSTSEAESPSAGPKQLGPLVIPELDFANTSGVDLTSASGVASFLESLEGNKAELSAQQQQVQDTKKRLGDMLKEAKVKLSSNNYDARNGIDSSQMANHHASELAASIRGNRSDAIVAHLVQESSVQKLLH